MRKTVRKRKRYGIYLCENIVSIGPRHANKICIDIIIRASLKLNTSVIIYANLNEWELVDSKDDVLHGRTSRNRFNPLLILDKAMVFFFSSVRIPWSLASFCEQKQIIQRIDQKRSRRLTRNSVSQPLSSLSICSNSSSICDIVYIYNGKKDKLCTRPAVCFFSTSDLFVAQQNLNTSLDWEWGVMTFANIAVGFCLSKATSRRWRELWDSSSRLVCEHLLTVLPDVHRLRELKKQTRQ